MRQTPDGQVILIGKIRNVPKPEPVKSKHPKRFAQKSSAMIRIQNVKTGDYSQEKGWIYQLNPQDKHTLTLYGGHQVIVLDNELLDFDDWNIVSLVELWS